MARRKKGKWLLLGLLGLVAAAALISRGSEPTIEEGSYLVVEIQGGYSEGAPMSSVSRLFDDSNVLVELTENLEKARVDSRIAGVVARIGPLATGWAQTGEIRESLNSIRAAGKPVITFMSSDIVGGNKEYYLASVGDQVIVPPAASPMLNGLSAHYYFLGALWEKLHIAMEVQQIREYKTFGDQIKRRTMSAAHREMADSLLDAINDEFLGTIAEDRGLSVEEMSEIIDSCPSSADDFTEAGLADGVFFFDELADEIDPEGPVRFVDVDDYAAITPESLGMGSGPRIAVIHAVGTIVSGEGGRRSAFGKTVGSDPLVKAFRDAMRDESIRAIVLRVDSPGGSATASDAVWRSTRLAREKKPVVTSFGDTAASGGYYMAAGTDHIVAEAGTLTGSIGVVMFKPNLAGLLGWMGVGTESLGRGRYSLIMDTSKGLDRAEASLLRTQMDGVYKRFLDRVAEGRDMTVEEVDAVGGGRVWTGRQALEIGLVDAIGGLDAAVRTAAIEAGIENPDEVELVFLPEPKGLLEQLTSLQGGSVEARMPAVLTETFDHLRPFAALEAGVHVMTDAIPTVR